MLSEQMLPPPKGADADGAILDALREHGLSLLPWSKDAEALRARLDWLYRAVGAPWPDVSDAALLSSLDDWLLPFLTGEAAFSRIDPGAVTAGLMSILPHDLRRRLDKAAPTHFAAPSGSNVPIRYDGETPVLAIRVQELFGLTRHPTIGDGVVPLTLELLSPAHRPIQTTRDLPPSGAVHGPMCGRICADATPSMCGPRIPPARPPPAGRSPASNSAWRDGLAAR